MLGDYIEVYRKAALRMQEFGLLVLIYEENHDFINLLHDSNFIDFNQSVVYLETRGYIKRHGEAADQIMLRTAGEQLFKNIGRKRNTKKADIEKWFDEWRELFPAGTNAGGYRYRGNRLAVLDKMTKFVDLYPYTKEQIFEATRRYIQRFQARGYAYMLLAHYFIEKKGVGSTLASECEALTEEPSKPVSSDYGRKVI